MEELSGRETHRRAHLVLSSAGVRCLSYIGALNALQKAGWEFASVSTCSAGTLIGALLGAGVSPRDMAEGAKAIDFGALGAKLGFPRRVWRLRRPPFAVYPESIVPGVFQSIVERYGNPMVGTLGQLDPPLATAAVDVKSGRILVFSSAEHPDMQIDELLRIATAVPLVYPSVKRQEGELVDAAVAWKVPVWLTAGFDEQLEIVALRIDESTYVAKRGRLTPKWVPWINDVVAKGIDSGDGVVLDSTPRLRLYDIPASRGPFDFDLSPADIDQLIGDGRSVVDEYEERADERMDRALEARGGQGVAPRDSRARVDALRRYDLHARRQTPTVFISYAREDRPWVATIRRKLQGLVSDEAVAVWDDSYIASGDNFTTAIIGAISRAKVMIVLVSESSTRSEFIMKTELPLLCERARRREGTLLWISLDGTPVPSELQAVYDAVGEPSESLVDHDAAAAGVVAMLTRDVEQALRDVLPGPV